MKHMVKKIFAWLACSFLAVFAVTAADYTIPDSSAIADGLSGFTDTLLDVIPNTVTQQNVWADAWIGKLVPSIPPHFGFGINAGVTELDLSDLKKAAEQLDIKGFSDTLAFPTVTADVRIGGIILPFDVGFTFCKLDTSSLGAYESAIDPVSFDFYTIGMDVRYALLKGGLLPKWSVGGGFYYLNGSVSADSDDADINLDFNTTTLFIDTQISKKILIFVPFAGARVLVSKSSADWDWNVNSAYTNYIKQYSSYKTSDSGSSDRGFGTESIQPQIFGGIGLDLLILDITVSGSYDFRKALPAGAVSVRLSL